MADQTGNLANFLIVYFLFSGTLSPGSDSGLSLSSLADAGIEENEPEAQIQYKSLNYGISQNQVLLEINTGTW